MEQPKAPQSGSRIAWGRYLLVFGVAAWMFILGILVGRGTAPVQFDTQALQKELAALRISMVKKEREAVERAIRGEDEKASLDFYEALKKDGPDTTLQDRGETQAIARPTDRPSHKTRAALMPKKKGRRVEPAARQAAGQKGPAARTDRLTIQVASLKDAGAAERIVANLKKDGYPAYLSKHAVTGKSPWFRVRVGRYADERQAAADMARLTQEQKNPILVQAENE